MADVAVIEVTSGRLEEGPRNDEGFNEAALRPGIRHRMRRPGSVVALLARLPAWEGPVLLLVNSGD